MGRALDNTLSLPLAAYVTTCNYTGSLLYVPHLQVEMVMLPTSLTVGGAERIKLGMHAQHTLGAHN